MPRRASYRCARRLQRKATSLIFNYCHIQERIVATSGEKAKAEYNIAQLQKKLTAKRGELQVVEAAGKVLEEEYEVNEYIYPSYGCGNVILNPSLSYGLSKRKTSATDADGINRAHLRMSIVTLNPLKTH